MEPPISLEDDEVRKSTLDWELLRVRSLAPGGFGPSRVDIWPRLLNVPSPTVQPYAESNPPPDPSAGHLRSMDQPAHRDERQIRLDTDRSFVIYPHFPPDVTEDKDGMQEKLHNLIVSIFRRRPRLNYFQGYHDIVSVLFLTLPPETQLACTESISLHRTRDSMGSTLEPVLGLLRVTKSLLRQADLPYAELLERHSPLPFYALSNLLTLFSHDMPTLSLIQHVFDYILCRPPIIIVYLATAIILSRKAEIQKLDGEEGVAHSLLSGLPEIVDHINESPHRESECEVFIPEGDMADEEYSVDGTAHSARAAAELATPESSFCEPESKVEQDDAHLAAPSVTYIMKPIGEVIKQHHKDQPLNITVPILDATAKRSNSPLKNHSEPLLSPDPASVNTVLLSPSLPGVDLFSPKSEPEAERLPPTPPPTPPHGHRSSTQIRTPKISLTSLLSHADALYSTYPPTHPSLALSSIMGPQSVVYTWSEDPAGLPEDGEAERMVGRPELVVYPFIEEEEDDFDADAKEASEHTGRLAGRPEAKKRRRLRKWGRGGERRRQTTMVVGAVLVLGIAMAVYGVQVHGRGVDLRGCGLTVRLGRGGARDWRRMGRWVGGALAGARERLVSGFKN